MENCWYSGKPGGSWAARKVLRVRLNALEAGGGEAEAIVELVKCHESKTSTSDFTADARRAKASSSRSVCCLLCRGFIEEFNRCIEFT